MKTGKILVLSVFVVVMMAWTLAPVVWTFITSMTPRQELYEIPPHWIPINPSFHAFRVLLGLEPEETGFGSHGGSAPDFERGMLNSAIVTSMTTIALLIISTLGGYAFARLDFRGKNLIFLAFVATMPISLFSVYIPLFRIMLSAGLYNTYQGLSLLYLGALIPIGLWLMRTYFESLPWDVEDSALIDGCSRVQALFRVVLPMSVPGIMALAIYSILACWNEFLAALIFAPTLQSKTITVVITEFVGKYTIAIDLMCAGAIISMIPPVVLAFILQRYLISGLTLGAQKG
jgi:multiple sugar transport system permease protein